MGVVRIGVYAKQIRYVGPVMLPRITIVRSHNLRNTAYNRPNLGRRIYILDSIIDFVSESNHNAA